MSVIVAVTKNNTTVVACDSQHYFGSKREDTENLVRVPKVIASGQSLLGGVGASIYDTLLVHYLNQQNEEEVDLRDEWSITRFFIGFWKYLREETHFVNDSHDPDDHSQFAGIEGEFLIANQDGIFTVDSDFTVMRFAKYAAIGSGDRFAAGAIHALYERPDCTALEVVEVAVGAAIALDGTCGGDVQTFEVTQKAR